MREVNFSDLGLQLTRTCRALKLWISIRYFGLAAFRQAIDACLDLAEHAQRSVEASPWLEVATPASLRRRHVPRPVTGVADPVALDAVQADLVAAPTAAMCSCRRPTCAAAV